MYHIFVPARLMCIPCYHAQNKGQMAKSPELSVSVMFCFCTGASWVNALTLPPLHHDVLHSPHSLIHLMDSLLGRQSGTTSRGQTKANRQTEQEELCVCFAGRTMKIHCGFQKMPRCHDAMQHYGRTLVQNWRFMTHPSTSLLVHFTSFH